MTHTTSKMNNVQLYKAPTTRDDYVLFDTKELEKFDKLSDLAERLDQIGQYEIAQEINDYIKDWQNTRTKKLNQNIQADIDIISERIEQEDKRLYVDDDTTFTNPKADLLDRLENIKNVWEFPKFKDVIKHDDEYFFRDNVLDKWTIRTTQRYWKSNIEKDPFKNQKVIPQRYKDKMKNKKEMIKREPIVREYNPRERLDMWNKQRVNINIDEIIENTKNKKLPYPNKNELLSDEEIKSEKRTDDKRVEFYKKAYAYENMESVDRYENYEREF